MRLDAHHIFIVEDNDEFSAVLGDSVPAQYRVSRFTNSEEALEAYRRENPPGIIITDIKLTGATGIDLITKLRAMDYPGTIILISGDPRKEFMIRAMRLGVSIFLEKPFDLHEFWNAIKQSAVENQIRLVQYRMQQNYDLQLAQMAALIRVYEVRLAGSVKNATNTVLHNQIEAFQKQAAADRAELEGLFKQLVEFVRPASKKKDAEGSDANEKPKSDRRSDPC